MAQQMTAPGRIGHSEATAYPITFLDNRAAAVSALFSKALFQMNMRWLLNAASDRLSVYILKVCLLSIASAIVASDSAVAIAVKIFGLPTPEPIIYGNRLVDWLAVVVIVPFLESLLTSYLCRFGKNNFPDHSIINSAAIGAIAGALHGLVNPYWFFGPAASFFVWSYAWFKWAEARGKKTFLVLFIPHMIQNGVGLSLMHIG